jgi:molybdopterin synthase sulfur carrier subunit
MRLRVKFFSVLREAVGSQELDWTSVSTKTAGELWEELVARHPSLAPYNASRAIAVNHEYVHPDQVLRDGDEVAFFPPVSGG